MNSLSASELPRKVGGLLEQCYNCPIGCCSGVSTRYPACFEPSILIEVNRDGIGDMIHCLKAAESVGADE